MKKLITLLLILSMLLALAACGNSTSGTTQQTQPSLGAEDQAQAELENKDNIDNSVVRESIAIAYKSVTSLSPWGTNNDTPGNYEVYEMLYECDAGGDMYPILADGTYEGSYMPGCDHEPGSNVYTVKIYDSIYDHNGNHVAVKDVASQM